METDRTWITQKRLNVYPKLLVITFVAAGIFWALKSKNMMDPEGKPLGYDFITYWAASKMALAGQASHAYNIPEIFRVEKSAAPALKNAFAWYYPPTFYVLVLPLALLPYLVSYLVFISITLFAYVISFRKVLRSREALWCLAGFSGLWLNLLQGQNAFLTAAFAALAIYHLEESPIIAGVFLGLLSMKPHLALLFPLALIAIRAWKALIAAGLTATAFLGIGVAALGTGTLKACLGSIAFARLFLENGTLPWAKMPTVFALLRMAHVPVRFAYAVHAIVAVAAVGAVWHVWRTSEDWCLRGAVLMTGTFLISPYIFDYDLAWLAFPIAWMTITGLRDGFFRGERELLVATWLLPLLMQSMVKLFTIQPAVMVIVSLLVMIVRRAANPCYRPTTSTSFSPSPSHAFAPS